ncbi:MAG: DUF1552 domain-containing protein [Isosphaeraceae bacterium]|nr:DUF1552 domain-containing protein [Isosphaeraceae bacterium]
MDRSKSRRGFLRDLGLGAAALPFVLNLPGVGFANQARRKQRLVILFSPNGVVPTTFWPDQEGSQFTLKESLQPLEPFRDRTLILNGISDKVRGEGDNHMRGIGCLLTGIELFRGNVMSGDEYFAGWARGPSIDQEIKNFLQASAETRTRFGSLEFGVNVPERADTWTRMVYAGPNKPLAPVTDPYQMLARLYSRMKHQENVKSILDPLQEDLRTVSAVVGAEDRRLLEEHATFVREFEKDLREAKGETTDQPAPAFEPGVKSVDDNMPKLSKMQIDLLVNSFAADFARVATLQYSHSAGDETLRWLGVEARHHDVSHKPDTDVDAQKKLTRINQWYCEQVAYLAKRLAETPEPGGSGSLLDNTLVIWTNELGKGNSHTLDNIPFVLVGKGFDFRMGRSLKYAALPHNRLWMSLAHAVGHPIKQFGNPDYCGEGVLSGLTG